MILYTLSKRFLVCIYIIFFFFAFREKKRETVIVRNNRAISKVLFWPRALFLSFSLFMKKRNNHKYTRILWSFIYFQKISWLYIIFFFFPFREKKREKERSVSSSKKNRANSKYLFWPRATGHYQTFTLVEWLGLFRSLISTFYYILFFYFSFSLFYSFLKFQIRI